MTFLPAGVKLPYMAFCPTGAYICNGEGCETMIAEKYKQDTLSGILFPIEQFKPFPDAEDRNAWEGLPPEILQKCVLDGERYLGYNWPSLPATLFIEFSRNGNRTHFQDKYFDRRTALCALVLAECCENTGRFIDDILNGIWHICEESTWVLPAHIHHSFRVGDNEEEARSRLKLPDLSKEYVDLFAGETAAVLALTQYLLGRSLDRLDPLLCRRIETEIEKRILEPYLKHSDFWWMGLEEDTKQLINNWNVWCNLNCLISFLLTDRNCGRRAAGVAKVIRSVDRFIDTYPEDGGCDEGPSYWNKAGGFLFDLLEMLKAATGGGIDVYDESKINEIGRYLNHVYIGGKYFVNFSDGSTVVEIIPSRVYGYGKRIGDPGLMGLGAYYCGISTDPTLSDSYTLLHRLGEIFSYAEMKACKYELPLSREVWLNQIQVLCAREKQGVQAGLFIAAKGGHNNESHNHNDVGNFIVYCNGYPVLVDIGVESYTRKTFSAERYTIWTMQSQYHNVPTVNGWQQEAGGSYKAVNAEYLSDGSRTQLSMGLENAYPEQAGIKKWNRTFTIARNEKAFIEIKDDFSLREASGDMFISLMTCCGHEFQKAGTILLQGLDDQLMEMTFDPDLFTPESESIEITDEKLKAEWGSRLYRIRLILNKTVQEGTHCIRVFSKSGGDESGRE
jgi:hypothetical protein